jgi:hypothetical protein
MTAPVALAGIDPGADSFGVYFDLAGNTNCVAAPVFVPFPAYLILMNPASPTSGFECSVTMSGAPHFVLATTSVFNCDLDLDWEVIYSDYVCVGPSAVPAPANGALVLITWTMMLQSPTELLFFVGPATVPSLPGGLPVLVGDGVLRRGAVASGDVNLPVAGINAAICPVGNEVSSFGAVKSLFR